PDLDCNTFDIWARRIAAGDVLSREMYHPWHWWAKEIAPLETWNRWYGAETFHQASADPYFAALGYVVFGAYPDPTPRLQALLGALSAGLTFLLARRFLRLTGAVAAGLLCALNGPLVFLEEFMLRENLMVPTGLLFLLALDSACRRPTLTRFAAAGA